MVQRLDDVECDVLIRKYNFLGYNQNKIEERLRMIDPYISLDMIRLACPYISYNL